MSKFSDSNYDILEEYFGKVLGDTSGSPDSWLLGTKKGVVSEGSIADIIYEDSPDYGFVPYVFIIEEIDENKFKMFYTGINLATHTVNGVTVSAATFEIGNDMYFRKDSFFYEYLVENEEEYRDFINTNRTFCFFGKIHKQDEPSNLYYIEFQGMKDYMELSIPDHNRTDNLVELIDVWFDQVNHEPYNMTKYQWSLLDAKEVDFRWLGYIASIYGIEINEDIDEFTLREWVDLLVYFLKRVGTYNDLYVVYNVFSAGSINKINIYERWQEWCQSGAGDIPPFKEFPGFFPSEYDYHWLEYYGIHPSGGAGQAWYDQFSPSGIPSGSYSIDMNPYPTLALEAPSAGCDTGSATPTGAPVITPHYITEIDLTSEPIGDNFEQEWILNKFYMDEFVRNWEYVRPVGKYVQYQELIAPACAQSRTGETESLYPLTSFGYFNTTFTGSALLSGSPPTDYSGQQTYVYTQRGASANWTITHSLSSSSIVVQAWQPTSSPSYQPMVRVIPNEIEIDSVDPLNKVHLRFNEQISGIANIAGEVELEPPYAVTSYYDHTGSSGNPWLIIHNLGTAAPSSAPADFGTIANFWTSPLKSFPDELQLVNDNRTQATWESNKTGEALVRTADYTHVQDTPSTTWNINHGTGTDGMIIQTFDPSGSYINPLSVTLPNRSTAVVEFETAQAGEAYFIWFKPNEIARADNSCDITSTGICASGIGHWKVGDGITEGYDPYEYNDIESPTASGDYWRVWQDTETYYIDFIVPIGEELTIREVGLFNVNNDLIYYSQCSELHKPEEVHTVFHYRSQALFVTESSSSSSSSTSSSSSSNSSSSSSSSNSSVSSSSSLSNSSSTSSSSSTLVTVLKTKYWGETNLGWMYGPTETEYADFIGVTYDVSMKWGYDPDDILGEEHWSISQYGLLGGGSGLKFGGDKFRGPLWRTLVNFDLSGLHDLIENSWQIAAAQIQFSRLRGENQTATQNPGLELSIYRVIEPWNEGAGAGTFYPEDTLPGVDPPNGNGCTWNKPKSGGDDWDIPGCDGDDDRFQTASDTYDLTGWSTNDRVDFAVTQDVRDWFDGDVMEGWLIKQTEEPWNPFEPFGYWTLESKESVYVNLQHRPYLRLFLRLPVSSTSSSTTSGTVTRRWGEKTLVSDPLRVSPQRAADNYNNVATYSTIREEFPDTAYGGGIAVVADREPDEEVRGLIQFDLNNLYKAVEDSSDIYSAKLILKCLGLVDPPNGSPKEDHPGGFISVHRVSEQWKYDQVTWNDRMTGRSWHDRGGQYHQSPTDEIYVTRESYPFDWDVTDDVKDFVDGIRSNFGWILTTYTEIWMYGAGFGSATGGSSTLRPYLEIEYNQRSSVSSSSISSSSCSWSSSSDSWSSSSCSISSSSTSSPFNPVTETWGDAPSANYGPVTADALLNNDENNKNYGANVNNRVGLDNVGFDRWQTVINFDISNLQTLSETGTSADIVSASLYMYQYASNEDWTQVNIHRLKKDWNEGTKSGASAGTGEVTFDSARHSEELWDIPGAGAPTDRESIFTDATFTRYNSKWYSWNVTEDIEYFMTEPTSANFGWVLQDNFHYSGDNKDFASRNYTDDTSKRPYLLITYNKSSSSSSISSSSSSISSSSSSISSSSISSSSLSSSSSSSA